MITEFNTSTPGSTVKKGSPNTIILLIGLGIVSYLGYRYVLNQANNVPSVTGAEKKLSTGVYHKPGYSA